MVRYAADYLEVKIVRPATVSMIALIGVATLAFSCVEAKVERPSYEVGEQGVLIIRNPSRFPMAVGGCNPSSYQERLPGRWVPDSLLRPACAFVTEPNGRHSLSQYELIQPRGSIRIAFPTDWLRATPGIMRVLQRVSVGCEFPLNAGDPIICHGVEQITTDPVVIFEPGTTEVVGRQ